MDPEVEGTTAPCAEKLRRLSGPMVYGRACGVRRRTASRCSRALPLGDDEDGGDEDEAVAAVAMVTGGDGNRGGEKRGGEEESWWW